MLKFFKSFFKKADEPVAPYKVETPSVSTISDVPVVVGEPPASVVVEGAGQVDIAPAKPAKKKPSAKKAPAVKKPRAPKKPKAE
jgi:hypothetical protein